ncbi:TRAP transporter small permease [Halomonas sp. H5]|uniref:TRAP transporter small permease n=1 Tax=Halomonas sp. H5 TaxID=3423910 RepID=UPI003D35A9D0
MSNLVNFLHRGCAVIGGIALSLMLLVAVLDIVLRMFGSPLPGSFEVIGWLAAVAIGSALGYTQAYKGHVTIRLLIDHFPLKLRLLTETAMWLLSMLVVATISYNLFVYATDMYQYGSTSETLRAPVYPWVYALACSMSVFTIVLLRDFICSLAALVNGGVCFATSGGRLS